MRFQRFWTILSAGSALICLDVRAHPQQNTAPPGKGVVTLDAVQVRGRETDLLGVVGSASQGVVGQAQFATRPLSRNGELVEVVPGTLATQHSGTGKANQFYLRGFNLDHGTDFSVFVDGVPMNMPTHAHGQGYLDLNSVIPELVDTVEFGKGPYYAEVGNFSSAGYAHMHTVHALPKGLFKFTGGEFGYYRSVVADSQKLGSGDLLYAGELNYYDGPWKSPEDLEKFNGMIRYTLDEDNWGGSINGKAYHANWNATNQIPDRAIQTGQLGMYGTMDPSDGGNSNRYSLSGNFWTRGDGYRNDFNAYGLYYDVGLFSNFSGRMNEEHGDQIKQSERRVVIGGSAEHTVFGQFLGLESNHTIGVQMRRDEIMGVALDMTEKRQVWDNVRTDDAGESNVGLYLKNQTHWLPKFRTIAALRTDFFDFDVKSRLAANFGREDAAILSPKLSLIAGPWADTEMFLNLGYGYHSNDARGATTRMDPFTRTPLRPASPLAWTRGGEIGVRTEHIKNLNSTMALWWLQVDSELVFVGDAGTTEPTGRSERFGVEWTNYYKALDWLTLDADLAFTSASYSGVRREENNVPNSVGRIISAGATVDLPYHLYYTARLRHFGHVPLNESGSYWAGDTSILNMAVGYQHQNVKVALDLFNVLGSQQSDIAYAYESRLAGENQAVDGILRHPVEPRMVRGSVSVRF